MNKLEIIDGMLMESMIESLEWTAARGARAAAVNKPIFLSILLFENEKNEERWLLLLCCPRHNPFLWNGLTAGCLMDELLSLCWFVCFRGYGPEAYRSAEEKTNAKRRKQRNSNQTRKQNSEWNQPTSRRAAVSLKMKWSGAGCVDGMGRQGANAPR